MTRSRVRCESRSRLRRIVYGTTGTECSWLCYARCFHLSRTDFTAHWGAYVIVKLRRYFLRHAGLFLVYNVYSSNYQSLLRC